MNIQDLYKIFSGKKISTDTRKIQKAEIFWAIKGEKFNGNKFINKALRKGASYAVTDDKQYKNSGKQIIYVNDSLKALQDLARHHIKELNIPVIALTGTNGKTTTKELTAECLKQKYKLLYTMGNFNNHLGVPLTILSADKSSELALIEMGANHQFEIDELCRIALPSFGLISNIGTAHIEGFGSPEIIEKTKTELYRFLEKQNGKVFLRSEDKVLRKHARNLQKTTYSQTDQNADVYGELTAMLPFVKVKIRFRKHNKSIEAKTNLFGKYNLDNILAAACIASEFNISPQQIQKALEAYTPANNRSQIIEKESNTIISDAYNANPSSMRSAISSFREIKHPSKLLILGDMLELGSITETAHKEILELALSVPDSELITVGELFGQIKNSDRKHFKQIDDLICYLKENKPENRLILIKASRRIRMEIILDFL